MGVFKKQRVSWIDYYVGGHRKRERIGPDKRLPETVLCKRNFDHCMPSPSPYNSPFLTFQVDTNLTPSQMKLDDIPWYKGTVEIPIIS